MPSPPPLGTFSYAELRDLYGEALRRGHLIVTVSEPDGTSKWALLYKRKRKPTEFNNLEEMRAALFPQH